MSRRIVVESLPPQKYRRHHRRRRRRRDHNDRRNNDRPRQAKRRGRTERDDPRKKQKHNLVWSSERKDARRKERYDPTAGYECGGNRLKERLRDMLKEKCKKEATSSGDSGTSGWGRPQIDWKSSGWGEAANRTAQSCTWGTDDWGKRSDEEASNEDRPNERKYEIMYEEGEEETVEVGKWKKYSSGFGSKLMQKMGYKEGEGLGKSKGGRRNPVYIEKHPEGKSLDWIMAGRSLECDAREEEAPDRYLAESKWT